MFRGEFTVNNFYCNFIIFRLGVLPPVDPFIENFCKLKVYNFYKYQEKSLSFIKFFFFFCLQLVTLICCGLHYNSANESLHPHHVMLVNGTFVGFTVILIALFAGYMMGTPINKRLGELNWDSHKWIPPCRKKSLIFHFFLDLFFSLIGAAMFIASGVLIIQFWNDSVSGKVTGFFSENTKNTGIAKGSLAIVNGILFLVDVVFTFRD